MALCYSLCKPLHMISAKAPSPISNKSPPTQLSCTRSLSSFPLLSLSSPPPTTTLLSHTLKTKEDLVVPVIPDDDPLLSLSSDVMSVLHPCVVHSNILFFKSGNYNVQVIVGDKEPEDKLIGRFRREVLRAGVIQESKRRRFFETTQDKRKRKAREAAKRNRRRRPQPRLLKQDKLQPSSSEREDDNEEDDNWESVDVEIPYCQSLS